MLSMHILIWIACSASKCVVTDGRNMRVIANGVNRSPVSRQICGKTKCNYTRQKFPYFTVVSLYSLIRIISISNGSCQFVQVFYNNGSPGVLL